jgi:hypothetical protein
MGAPLDCLQDVSFVLRPAFQSLFEGDDNINGLRPVPHEGMAVIIPVIF